MTDDAKVDALAWMLFEAVCLELAVQFTCRPAAFNAVTMPSLQAAACCGGRCNPRGRGLLCCGAPATDACWLLRTGGALGCIVWLSRGVLAVFLASMSLVEDPPPSPPPSWRRPWQVAPLLPPSQHPWLAAVQADRYYHLLLPLTVPVTIAAIALNWFSMKLFKHNS